MKDSSTMSHLLCFSLSGRRFGLALDQVERVVRMVDVTPLPHAPRIVSGVVNHRGRIVPVIDIRSRFGLPPRETALSDQLIIAANARWPLALHVETVGGVVEHPDHAVQLAASLAPGVGYLRGVVKTDGEMVLLHDLDLLLSHDEACVLDQALAA